MNMIMVSVCMCHCHMNKTIAQTINIRITLAQVKPNSTFSATLEGHLSIQHGILVNNDPTD